ncbi:hypothetical protein C8A03DRAFT_44049 [Achaetomium macrosporum]|uniref:Uncharacterized protein n=1 Tax=Achaetomium macrosporum TaxID=79813 RepID=A0AAN7CAI2_9PEZI|nr:hypothetical protein C8A03DRAFT_44049 [Achaetomium macrosporum]
MEREEYALRRKCEELRLALEDRTKELSQSRELYSKLKHRVLLNQTQDIAPSLARSQTPVQTGTALDASRGHTQSQLPRPVMPVAARTGVSSYFPASPGYSKTQPSSNDRLEWNKPALSHSTVPATPSSNLPLRNPRTPALASTPRTGVGSTFVPGSGRFYRTASGSQGQITDRSSGFSGVKTGVAGLKYPLDGGNLNVAMPSLERTEAIRGPPRASLQTTARRPSQFLEPPGLVLRHS